MTIFSKNSTQIAVIKNILLFFAWLIIYIFSAYGISVASVGNKDCANLALMYTEELQQCILLNSENGQFIDFSDGIFSYFTGLPSEPGVGLTPDPEGYGVLKNDGKTGFHNWAIKKGYSVAVFSERCNSGRINKELVETKLKCSPDKSIKIYKLKSL
jgi:hypothetical protein